jgi:uroporphyrinogen III methyltransferase / synthase
MGGMDQTDVAPADREKSLLGVRVLVTRPQVELDGAMQPSAADPLALELRRLGADVFLQPAIRILPPADWRPVDAVLARLHEFDWLVFSSANGVRAMLERLRTFSNVRSTRSGLPASLRVAAIGPGTAEELAGYGISADLVPNEYRAEALADALTGDAKGNRFLLARASRGREVLAETLSAAGGNVEQVVVYKSIDIDEPDPEIVAALRAGRIDWATVTSSAIARSLARLFGPDLHRMKLASISPITSGVLHELGYEPEVEATPFTLDALAAAIAERA